MKSISLIIQIRIEKIKESIRMRKKKEEREKNSLNTIISIFEVK